MNKKKISRRETLRWIALTTAASLAACSPRLSATQPAALEPTATPPPPPTPTPQPTATKEWVRQTFDGPRMDVLMTTSIGADALVKIYEALGRKANGKVAVKISSGEPGGHHFLSPDLIAPLVKSVKGTIVECNTAYGGMRGTTKAHQKVMKDHGFEDIAPVDIMDAEGTMNLPIVGGKNLNEDVVGAHFANYDFVVNLAHFKGHAMGGFGGVIKNMSIGIASTSGKCLIHTAGKDSSSMWGGKQDPFLESMAEAAKGVADYVGKNILYINVMNLMSIDCDCDSDPAEPTMKDIGILASLDPVALDQASVDLVYAAPDGKDLITRLEGLNGLHTLEHSAAIGLGSRNYALIDIDA